jgi:hypothetical protein
MTQADDAAQRLQAQVQRRRRHAIRFAFGALAALAAMSLTIGHPAPLIFCPVVVYLMIRQLEALRMQPALFHFVSLRLCAETLRLLIAVRGDVALLDWMLKARKAAAHEVSALAALASQTFEQVVAVNKVPSGDTWTPWDEEQRAYFDKAEARERARATRGRRVFNGAFVAVGLIGMVTLAIALAAPGMTLLSSLVLLLTAMASTVGGCGLAYVSYVRDMRAFDHSFDYLHMKAVFAAYPHDPLDLESSRLRLLREAANEQERWALRMAGHFRQRPH